MRSSLLTLALALAGHLAGQESRPQPDAAAAERAVEAWLAEPESEAHRDRATRAVLDAGVPAFDGLVRRLQRSARAAATDPAALPRQRALQSLVASVALGFIDDALQTGMIFAGQYDPLRVLQPYAGELYLNLLLDTPDWFAEQRRALLVPALRDLYPESPGEDNVRAIYDIAADDQLETWGLRLTLFCALSQWGDRTLIDAHIDRLQRRIDDDDDEDRLQAMRELAHTRYLLRDYRRAAPAHRAFLRRAEREEFPVTPVDYYNAACNLSLLGDLDAALDELERCVDLLVAGVDSSLQLEPTLFERDPEIANVRKTKRFAALYARAFDNKSPED